MVAWVECWRVLRGWGGWRANVGCLLLLMLVLLLKYYPEEKDVKFYFYKNEKNVPNKSEQ